MILNNKTNPIIYKPTDSVVWNPPTEFKYEKYDADVFRHMYLGIWISEDRDNVV